MKFTQNFPFFWEIMQKFLAEGVYDIFVVAQQF